MANRFVTLTRAFPNRLQAWLPIIFLIAAGPLTAFLAFAVPAGEAPDEVAHIARADSLTHGKIAGFRHQGSTMQGNPETQAVVLTDAGLALVGFGFLPGIPLAEKHVTLDHVFQMTHVRWERHLTAQSVPNTAVYPPTFYIPAAIAIRVARGGGGSPYIAFLAARLVNGMIYVGAGAAAIGLARRGRVVMLCLLCLPMSLWLAASVNQDGLIIATAALAAALLTRQSRACWWVATVLLGLAAMAKPYMAVLALVLPATYPGPLGRPALGGLLVASVPAALWTATMSVFVAVPFIRPPPMPAGPLWTGPAGTIFSANSPLEQLHILLASPLRFVTLPVATISALCEALWREFIGVLGALDVMLPEDVYQLWAEIIILAIAGSLVLERQGQAEQPHAPKTVTNLVILVSLIAAVLTAFVLQYLSWTRVGSALVEGVQGRYFIPIAVFTIPLLQFFRRPCVWTGTAFAAVASVVSIAALANAVFLPLLVIFAYYTR